MLQSSYKKHESISTTSPCWRSQRGPIPWLLLEPNLFQACLLFFKMVHDASGKRTFLSQLTKYCKFYLVKPRWAVAWGCWAPAMMCGRAMRRARNGARTIPSPIQSSLSPVLPFYIARCLWQPSLCSAAIVNVTKTQIRQCYGGQMAMQFTNYKPSWENNIEKNSGRDNFFQSRAFLLPCISWWLKSMNRSVFFL